MTFLAYLAAQGDDSAQFLREALSGLAGEANGIAEVCAHLRATLAASEASLAVEEARYRWERYIEESPLRNMRSLAVRVPKLPKRNLRAK